MVIAWVLGKEQQDTWHLVNAQYPYFLQINFQCVLAEVSMCGIYAQFDQHKAFLKDKSKKKKFRKVHWGPEEDSA